MKRIVILLFSFVTAFSAYCQSNVHMGDSCFSNGDYNCAKAKYEEAIKSVAKKDKQDIEIKLDKVNWCAEQIQEADRAFANKKYKEAKEIYESVLVPNPSNPYVNSQVKKCNEILFIPTKLPTRISGPVGRCSGDYHLETYTLEGALLGSEAKYWRLFEDGKEMRSFTKDTLRLAPAYSTRYRIFADNNSEKFFEFEIVIVNPPVLTGTIDGVQSVCPGSSFELRVVDFNLSDSTKLVWYKIDDVSKDRKPLGYSDIVKDVIYSNSYYEVELNFQGCVAERKVYKSVFIAPKPNKPVIASENVKGKRANLSVSGTGESNLKYQWSKDGFATITGNGSSIKGLKLDKSFNTIYVRAIDECGAFSDATVKYINRPRTGYFFMNVGAVASDLEKNFETFMVAIGGKHIYVRVKLNPSMLGTADKYSTSFSNSKLEITNSGKVTNFPASTGYYYVVNDQMAGDRQAATLGTTLGWKKLRFYVGAGYGERTNLWGLNLYSYDNYQNIGSSWATNVDQSWKGIEGEAGLFLKLGYFNLMGGASAIFDSKQDAPYIDFHLGIGFSTR